MSDPAFQDKKETKKGYQHGNEAVKVSVKLLESLMSLAGELVLSRNQLLQGIHGADMKTIELSGQRIDIITSEIQDAIMRTRMQPVGSLFDKLIPIVKTLGQKYGRSVDLDTGGKDVEMDKTILETIYDPLRILAAKCIKNATTAPEAEKSLRDRMVLSAFHDTGQVNISMSYDGAGISDDDIPGDVTGPIEELSGIIEVDHRQGEFADIQIKLPLTLSIIPSQIISLGSEKYAIPQNNLSELLRIPAAEVKNKIEKIGDAEVVRLRGELLPLLNLPKILDIERSYIHPVNGNPLPEKRNNLADRRSKTYSTDGRPLTPESPINEQDLEKRNTDDRRQHHASGINIAVVLEGNYKYGLVADQFHDSEEIVVKPMGRHLKKYTAYAGATIMGDGKVAVILDILNLAQMAQLSTRAESSQMGKVIKGGTDTRIEKESVILFRHQDNEYFSAPLRHVQRIERILRSDIEHAGPMKIIQYRGGTLPLYELSQAIDVKSLPEKEQQEVVVFKIKDKEFGLMVTPPVDTINIDLSIDDTTLKQGGIIGSAVIAGHTTLFIDVPEMAGQLTKKDK